jgi:hypothetical protein
MDRNLVVLDPRHLGLATENPLRPMTLLISHCNHQVLIDFNKSTCRSLPSGATHKAAARIYRPRLTIKPHPVGIINSAYYKIALF